MIYVLFFCIQLFGGCTTIVDHKDLPVISKDGNTLRTIASSAIGSEDFIIWHITYQPGNRIPFHTHDSEEILLFLSGQGKLICDEKEHIYEAPCTAIVPPGVRHQVVAMGSVPTDVIVIVGSDTSTYNEDGKQIWMSKD